MNGAELLILVDGTILAHNLTPEIAEILSELDPRDEKMAERAEYCKHHELPAGN